MMISAIKKEDDKANRSELEDTVVDYKLGIMDPGRTVAGFERLNHIKKANFGKKQLYAKLFRNLPDKNTNFP